MSGNGRPDGMTAGGDGESRTLALQQTLTAIRQRWWLVLSVFLVVVGGSTWRTSRQPRLYSATSTVRIQDAQTPIAGIQSPTYRDYRVDPIQSEQQVIKSDPVAKKVVSALGLNLVIVKPPKLQRSQLFGTKPPVIDSALTFGNFTVHLRQDGYDLVQGERHLAAAGYGTPVSAEGLTFTVPARPPPDAADVALQIIPLQAAAGRVRGSIVTRSITQTNIVEITWTGTDPVTVRDVTNSLAQAYIDFSSEGRKQQARRRTEFIRAQLDTQEKRVGTFQQGLRAFKEREQLTNVGTESGALSAEIHKFESDRQGLVAERNQYVKLIGKLSAADTLTDELRRLAGTEAIQKNSYIAKLYERMFELSRQREELLIKYNAVNPDVKAVDRLITSTKQDLKSASGLYLEGLQSRIESLDATVSTLRRQTEKYPSLEAQEAKLVADVRSAQAVYDQLQTEYQRARITEQSDDLGVRTIDPAGLPSAPISPDRKRSLITAILFGLLLGLGAAIVVENLDDSVKSPDEIRDRLGLTVLGTIPRIREPGAQRTRGERENRPLVTHIDPRSPVAEAYRSLRTNLAFARAHQDLQVIVLTSPGPADGKSTTVANLAITFAQQGQRTLLIDADLRRPVLDKMMNVPRTPGLTDVLIGATALSSAYQATEIPNLSLLGSGAFPPNPSELLGSPAMQHALSDAKAEFDIILLDSPPLLAVTDAAVLSTLADGTIIVVRVESTARAAIRRAVGQLHTVGGRIAGVVLNDVDFRRGAFTGSYGYYYYYYYGHEGSRLPQNGILGRVRQWARSSATEQRP